MEWVKVRLTVRAREEGDGGGALSRLSLYSVFASPERVLWTKWAPTSQKKTDELFFTPTEHIPHGSNRSGGGGGRRGDGLGVGMWVKVRVIMTEP